MRDALSDIDVGVQNKESYKKAKEQSHKERHCSSAMSRRWQRQLIYIQYMKMEFGGRRASDLERGGHGT